MSETVVGPADEHKVAAIRVGKTVVVTLPAAIAYMLADTMRVDARVNRAVADRNPNEPSAQIVRELAAEYEQIVAAITEALL